MKKATTFATALRGLILLLVLSMVLSLAAVPAGAADVEESEYVTWTHDVTLKGYDPMTGETRAYSKVMSISSRIRFMPMSYYHYANQAVMLETAYSVTGNDRNGDFLILSDGTLMATAEGKKHLNALPAYKRGFAEYRLISGSGTLMSYIDEEFYAAVKTTYGIKSQPHTLFSLRSTACYTILGFNEDGWFGVPLGFIFEKEDGLYYASALYLTDDCFDEEGRLQPKSGVSLDLYPLSEELSDQAYDEIRRIGYKGAVNTYEGNTYLDGILGGMPSPGETYASVIFLGILLPIAPVTVGLCLPRSERLGRKKRWYLLAILGGAWLVLGVITLVITIACM